MSDSRYTNKQKEQNEQNLTQVWTTERVNHLHLDIESGIDVKNTPFWDGKPEWRNANIIFEYTPTELDEIKRCASDVIYYANNYCFTMTDDGIKNIKLRDYQEDVLRDFQDNRFCVFLSPRQVGKTICTGIFLSWYLLFNSDKNLMVLSNTGATTIEIIDKIKVILQNLPFFMKPGIIMNNQMTMKFDNGCRLLGRNTTKTAAIGMTIHSLYMDELAHVHSNFIEPFWRSVYPTLSSSNVSRMIVTSTPNGMNKFYDIYVGALEGTNEFKPIRVDWWQVPGRDEEWMKREIGNLGSIESFNQEYGCQFLSSSKLLLDHKTMGQIKRLVSEFEWREITELHNKDLDYEHLKWHPKFDLDTIKETDRFAFTIDTANGGGGDYTVLNIFKVVPMPEMMIEQQISYTDEGDFISLLQVGIFRSNKAGVEELQPIIETLLYDIFGEDAVKISLEMDFKGNLLYERMSNHNKFYEDIFIHTKHSENSKRLSPGIKLNVKNKYEFCMEFRRMMRTGRILSCDLNAFNELLSFGLNKKGSYSSQIGHDDIVMTMVNLVPFFTSEQYFEIVENIYDGLDVKYKTLIANKLDIPGEVEDKKFDSDLFKDMMG